MSEQPLIPQFTIGDRLRKAREATGLDQQAFAEEIGISRGSLSAYESDKTPVKRPVLLAWSIRTNVPIEWLRDGAQARPANDDDPGAAARGGVTPKRGTRGRKRLPHLDSNQEPAGYMWSLGRMAA